MRVIEDIRERLGLKKKKGKKKKRRIGYCHRQFRVGKIKTK